MGTLMCGWRNGVIWSSEVENRRERHSNLSLESEVIKGPRTFLEGKWTWAGGWDSKEMGNNQRPPSLMISALWAQFPCVWREVYGMRKLYWKHCKQTDLCLQNTDNSLLVCLFYKIRSFLGHESLPRNMKHPLVGNKASDLGPISMLSLKH